jgi:predicted MFS family arabinose efflux permease
MITGIGMSMGLYDAAFGTLGRLLGKDARGAITGVTLMAGFSNTLGWPLGAWLVGAYGWRVAVASYAVTQILVILPVLLIFVPKPGPPVAAPQIEPRQGEAPADPKFFWMAAHFMLRQAISSVISVHALVLLAGMGFGTAETVLAASLIGPAQVGSRVIDWFYGRRLNPMVAAIISSVLLPTAMLALGAGLPAFVFTLVYGISNGIFTINRGTLPLYVFGATGYAARVGRLAMPAMIAAALTPTLITPLILAWPTSWVMGVLAAFGAAALLCLLRLRT